MRYTPHSNLKKTDLIKTLRRKRSWLDHSVDTATADVTIKAEELRMIHDLIDPCLASFDDHKAYLYCKERGKESLDGLIKES